MMLLVGTAKGLFVVRSDDSRATWTVDGPHFGGWQAMHAKGSPVDPDRVYASVWTDWMEGPAPAASSRTA